MRIKYIAFALILTACASANRGSIDDATILNWENESVTMEQFVRDHKACLGINKPSYMPRSRIAKLLAPNQSGVMPDCNQTNIAMLANVHCFPCHATQHQNPWARTENVCFAVDICCVRCKIYAPRFSTG